MIMKLLIDGAFNIIYGIFKGFELISLPVNIISVLGEILIYGTWVVGPSIMLLFVGTVTFWWGVHLSVGLALWVYEKIPFI